jgi:branched-chain amino acid transport system substrate-binding protein
MTKQETAQGSRALNREPIKVGLLGGEMKAFEREVRMAFDEGIERGLLDRSYELVFELDAGLPQGTAASGVASFNRLVDAGCIAVIGANYTDAAIPIAPQANARQVPVVSMCGTDQFHGEYCFRVGNGDVGDEPALIVNWLKRNGHKSIAVVSPASPIGEEYFTFLRQECRRMGIRIAAMETISMSVRDLPDVLSRLRANNPDALVWNGFGGLFVSGQVRAALEEISWDPPRIVTTAFMQYLHGFHLFEGWVGIDQWCPENPRMHLFHKRFVERYKEDPRMWPNAIPGLCYDMAAIVVEGIHRAPILSGPGIKKGLERIRYMPAVTGGPNTHISAGPYDHQMFKGDWLHYGTVRNGKLEFAGLFEATLDY